MPSKTAWLFAAAMGIPSLALIVFIRQRSESPSAENSQVFAKRDVDPALRPKLNEPPPTSLLVSTVAAPSASSLNFLRPGPGPEAQSAPQAPPAPSAAAPEPIPKTAPKQPLATQTSPAEKPPDPQPRPKFKTLQSEFDMTRNFKKITFHTRDATLLKSDPSMSNSLLKTAPDKKPQTPPPSISTAASNAAARQTPPKPPESVSKKAEAALPAAPPQAPASEPASSPATGGVVNLDAVQSAPTPLQRTPKGGVPLDPGNPTSE